MFFGEQLDDLHRLTSLAPERARTLFRQSAIALKNLKFEHKKKPRQEGYFFFVTYN